MNMSQLCGVVLFWMVLSDSLIRAQEKPAIPTPSNMIATQAVEALDRSFSFSGERPLAELAKYLTDEVGVPVWLDERSVKFAKLDASKQMISFNGEKVALRTTLHRSLMPIGLRIKIDSEGLVITADTLELARKNIGTSTWVNAADDEADVISAALNESASFSFSDRKLSEVVEDIAEQYKINVLVDHRALEEIGVSVNSLVTISIKNVKLKSALRYILKEIDLTYIYRDETLWITTYDGCEANLLDRIYWIEGTEFDRDTLNDLIMLVQTTISPDTWESLGGPSTMTTGPKSDRPFVLVSTSRVIHEEIDHLLKGLRDGNFEPSPEIKMEKSVE